jgi:hypothetical protein
MMKKVRLLIILISLPLWGFNQSDKWLTDYEKSDFLETPRYKQTIEYCKKLADHSSWIEYKTFGKSPQNRDLPLLIVDKNGNFDPSSVNNSGNLILLVEACIHPGESEGKDAGLMLLRDIAIKKQYTDLLDNITLMFIPIFNVDGHERFGPYNRINQNGPKEMGWRTTAQNLNLNRDFLKADAPEMQSWLKMFNRWMPDFFIDIHTTDGADYQYVITYAMEVFGNMDKALTDWQKQTYLNYIKPRMKKSGYPVFRYISFREWHNPRSGMVAWAAEPRLSEGYTAIRNRPGLLVETHMLKDYKTRVSGTYEILKLSMEVLDKERKQLKKLIQEADDYTASAEFREKKFPVQFEPSDDSTIINFKGIEYDVVKSDLTGANWFQYGDEPKTFQIPYFNDLQPITEVSLPEYYIIPPQWIEVIKRIKLHGVKTKKLQKELTLGVETYKFKNVKWNQSPYEGRQRIQSFQTDTLNHQKTLPKGSVIVSMNQKTARVIAHMLEPVAPDSFLKWGFFNAVFEQKEYAEMYVMEKKAREMLQDNEQLREKFEAKMENEPSFANNPWAMLNWFYKKTPYWDEKKNVYPVSKIFNEESISILKNNMK